MDNISTLQATLTQLCEPICVAHGVTLVDARYLRDRGAAVVRVMIERPETEVSPVYRSGVTVEDCRLVSRDLSAALDVHEELIPGSFHLEVGSPGIERPLIKAQDFERFVQRRIRVQTRLPIASAAASTSTSVAPEAALASGSSAKGPREGGRRRNFQGVLVGRVDDQVHLRCDDGEVQIPFDLIIKAHLVAIAA